MRSTLRLGCLAVAATATTALFAGPADASPGPNSAQHAVFVQTDETTGNHVASYWQASDGTLTLAYTYATGGLGGVLGNSVIDHLASQGAVTYDGPHKLLYVVNAGSNSVSIFGVDGANLSLRQVVRSGGSFPVSVAVHGDSVYVLNGHDGGSIQGYVEIGGHLLLIPWWNRHLGLDPTQRDFTQSPGQVAFSPDGTQLIVTTKANGNNIDVFALNPLTGPAATPVVTNDPNGVPFALAFDRHGNVQLVSAGTASVDTYRLKANGKLKAVASTPTGQAGTCWVISDGKLLFATNPGSASISTFVAGSGGHPTLVGSTPTDAGTVDPVVSADGKYLYVETGAAGIVDEYAVHANGALTRIGSVMVANAAGAEGIATA
jgi:6-phosphogluconolactonase (cycloisomerase 2 family)